ncbi:MAG: AmmeMemoRadiSam system protein B [Candidatus Cloacimonetes bacterium HGW-Cloacimonetes-2]|jgi:hypothetical protein|nr:MAG: AmmeMemoRadiSam system protein B [Candidatus Cloacimonetes bacterium HGW-Cloacimonetes-2]
MQRKAVHSGTFYPRFEPQILRQINKWLEDASPPSALERSLGLIVPHAGYMYSGKCASLAYHNLSYEQVDSFIILHPSHHGVHFNFALSPYTIYESPLGNLELDSELAMQISPHCDSSVSYSYHQNEHSMEIQLPLIKHFFPHTRIVPIMLGRQTPENAQKLAAILYDVIIKSSKRIVVLVSTDLSHYHQSRVAEQLDGNLIQYLENIDTQGLWEAILNNQCEACGIGAVLTLMYLAKLYSTTSVKVIQYTHSGQMTDNNQQVVGYLAAKFLI